MEAKAGTLAISLGRPAGRTDYVHNHHLPLVKHRNRVLHGIPARAFRPALRVLRRAHEFGEDGPGIRVIAHAQDVPLSIVRSRGDIGGSAGGAEVAERCRGGTFAGRPTLLGFVRTISGERCIRRAVAASPVSFECRFLTSISFGQNQANIEGQIVHATSKTDLCVTTREA